MCHLFGVDDRVEKVMHIYVTTQFQKTYKLDDGMSATQKKKYAENIC